MKKSITAAVPLIMVLVGCGGGSDLREGPAPSMSPAPTTFIAKGSLLLDGGEVKEIHVDGECPSFGDGYSDIGVGAQVKVLDPAGAVLAFDSLLGGEPVDPFEHSDGKTYTDECRYLFSVLDVPEGYESYGIEISHRGVIQFTREQLDVPVELSLG